MPNEGIENNLPVIDKPQWKGPTGRRKFLKLGLGLAATTLLKTGVVEAGPHTEQAETIDRLLEVIRVQKVFESSAARYGGKIDSVYKTDWGGFAEPDEVLFWEAYSNKVAGVAGKLSSLAKMGVRGGPDIEVLWNEISASKDPRFLIQLTDYLTIGSKKKEGREVNITPAGALTGNSARLFDEDKKVVESLCQKLGRGDKLNITLFGEKRYNIPTPTPIFDNTYGHYYQNGSVDLIDFNVDSWDPQKGMANSGARLGMAHELVHSNDIVINPELRFYMTPEEIVKAYYLRGKVMEAKPYPADLTGIFVFAPHSYPVSLWLERAGGRRKDDRRFIIDRTNRLNLEAPVTPGKEWHSLREFIVDNQNWLNQIKDSNPYWNRIFSVLEENHLINYLSHEVTVALGRFSKAERADYIFYQDCLKSLGELVMAKLIYERDASFLALFPSEEIQRAKVDLIELKLTVDKEWLADTVPTTALEYDRKDSPQGLWTAHMRASLKPS